MSLDPKSEAWLQRVVDEAKPLSQRQQDLISAAFRGAFDSTGTGMRLAGAGGHRSPGDDEAAGA